MRLTDLMLLVLNEISRNQKGRIFNAQGVAEAVGSAGANVGTFFGRLCSEGLIVPVRENNYGLPGKYYKLTPAGERFCQNALATVNIAAIKRDRAISSLLEPELHIDFIKLRILQVMQARASQGRQSWISELVGNCKKSRSAIQHAITELEKDEYVTSRLETDHERHVNRASTCRRFFELTDKGRRLLVAAEELVEKQL